MRTIRELILAIDTADEQHYPYWMEQLERKERLYALFVEIQNPAHHSDADVCRIYCGKTKSTAYSKAKMILREELSDLLFLQHFSSRKKDEKEENYRRACRNLLLGRWLMQDNRYAASENLLWRLGDSAEKPEVRGFALEALGMLRYLYAMIKGDRHKYFKMTERIRHQLDVHAVELELSGKVEGIFLEILTKREVAAQNREVQNVMQWLAQTGEIEPTPLLVHHSSFVQVMDALSKSDFERAIGICRKAVQKLKTFKGKSQTQYLRTFKLQLASCYMHLNRPHEMQQTLNWLLQHTPRKGINWVVVKELECKWLLRRGRYADSWNLIGKVKDGEVFAGLSRAQRERWKLLEAYAYLFLTGMSGEEPSRRLKIQKELNSIKHLSQDKEGYNVSLLILQILTYAKLNKQDYLIDMTDALGKYINRYLCKEKTPRLYYIMRLLLLLPRHGFNARICRRKAESYLQKLRASSLSRHSYEVEIIPFEKVWNFALQLVESSSIKWQERA